MRLSEVIIEVSEKVWELTDIANYWVNNKTWIEISDRKVSEDTSTYKIIRKNYFAYNPYRVNVWSIGLFDWELWAVSPAYVVFKVNEEKIVPQLLLRFLKSKKWIFEINRHTHGGVRKSLSLKDLWKIDINIPDIKTQRLFVEWWSENISLIEKFNKTIKENKILVDKLRWSILQDAIFWNLVKWDENDESAIDLLEKIRKEKDVLIKEWKIKKERPPKPISNEEKFLDLWWNNVRVRLSEIANIEKWRTWIMKAIPWEYPMYTTAELPITHNEYQIDWKAVMIPLVSSTGHWHASIKRLHYWEWKFAVGSILSTVQSYGNIINTKYLYSYLTAFKEKLLVSQMKWTANVSLTIDAIKNVIVPIPTLKNQEKLDELMKLCDELEEKINSTWEDWEKLIDSVLQNIFRDS